MNQDELAYRTQVFLADMAAKDVPPEVAAATIGQATKGSKMATTKFGRLEELAADLDDDQWERVQNTFVSKGYPSALGLAVGLKVAAQQPADLEIPVEVDAALEAAYGITGDWQPIIAALEQLAAPVAMPTTERDSVSTKQAMRDPFMATVQDDFVVTDWR